MRKCGESQKDHDNCAHTIFLQLCSHWLYGNLQIISGVFEKERYHSCSGGWLLCGIHCFPGFCPGLCCPCQWGWRGSTVVWPFPHYHRDCAFPSWHAQRPWRVNGKKAILVFPILFLFSLFPPQVSDLLFTGFFGTPVQVTGVLSSWFLRFLCLNGSRPSDEFLHKTHFSFCPIRPQAHLDSYES